MSTVLITGGSRGIGFACAKVFLKHGYHVIITGTNEKTLKSACERLGNEDCKYIAWDIANVAAAEQKMQEADSLFGRIDTFINNAGIVSPKGYKCGKFPDMNEQSWDKVMDINLKGTVFACQEQAKYMIANGIKGHIVNVCSEMGFRAAYDPYTISKWGIRGFTAGAARILAAHGIVLNGIAPGETATEILGAPEETPHPVSSPRGWRAMPMEIAEEIFFLANRANIIGEILISDGGRSIHETF